MKCEFDFIIVGAGCVGLSMALALPAHFRIALIDVSPLQKMSREKPDQRVWAINRQSENLFKALGVWPAMVSDRVSPYLTMKVWDSTGSGKIEFDCRDRAEPNLGHIIEQAVIHNALIEMMNTRDNVTLLAPRQLLHLQQFHDSVELRTQHEVLTAKYVIGADGANSWCRREAGFDVDINPYEHTAIVATIQCEKPHERQARQCFMPSGPLALLPLADEHLCSIVWSAEPRLAESLLSLDEKQFNQRLTQASEACLGNVSLVSPCQSFPLIKRHVSQYYLGRVILVGDAAHTIHPLAGQGINLGFADAIRLSSLLMSEEDLNELKNSAFLNEYHLESRAQNQAVLFAMDGFKHLFGSRHFLIQEARNIGLNWCDQSGVIKKLFMDHALG